MEAKPIVKGKVKFGIPAKVMSGEIIIAMNKEKIGQLAVIVRTDPVTDVSTFAFTDMSVGGERPSSAFLQCYMETDGGGLFIVLLSDENLLTLIEAFEFKREVTGELLMIQDLQNFDMYYAVNATIVVKEAA